MGFVTTKDGTRLFVRDWGAPDAARGRGRPVVLVHGWPANADMWEYQAVPLLEAGHRVVAYDRRGFGRSDQPTQGYDYDTFADDLAAVIAALGLRDALLVGFSMGGGEVVRYLSRHGDAHVAGCALVGSVTPHLLRTPANPDGVPAEALEGTIAKLRADRPAFLAGFAKGFYGRGALHPAVSDEILDWTRAMALLASPVATIACVRAFGWTDFRRDVAAVAKPTLIVHGTADVVVPFGPTGQAAHAALPGSVLAAYDGAPHGLFVTHAAELARDLLAFAQRV